jgi:hypothetical protein
MSRGDEGWSTAYNVLHAGLRASAKCAIKIAASNLSHPIMRRLDADLEEKQELRGGINVGSSLRSQGPSCPGGLLLAEVGACADGDELDAATLPARIQGVGRPSCVRTWPPQFRLGGP